MGRQSVIAVSLAVFSLLGSYNQCLGGRQKEPQPASERKAKAASGASAGQTGALSSSSSQPASQEAPVQGYEILNSWPHDRNAFTQGLVFYKGALYESTGQYGASSLRRVELSSGKVLKKVSVPAEYFAEGMTIFGNKIYQLTWKAQKGFIYDLNKFKKESEFSYEGEGWGLTHDSHSLIMSDGTNHLRFLNPATLQVERTIDVYDHDRPLVDLNELEFIKGEIYANIWHSERIVRIDPNTGRILGWLDLTGLRLPEDAGNNDNVLNGIAYDESHDRLFVTGKRWSKIFEIKTTATGKK